jgi:threonine dehydratase
VLPTLSELESAAQIVQRDLQPTPQLQWPLLSARCGCEVFVKHENHLPTGSFKVRGGLVYHDDLRRRGGIRGVIAATRGNHGQSVAFAARRNGFPATIVIPHGNSASKNAAMQALGATLVEHGRDFQDAFEHARALSDQRGLHMVPSFHPRLVCGVGSYALEFFRAVPDCDTLYVPIGLGSGICGVVAAREALGLATRVVGVVAERAPAYRLSFERGEPVETAPPDTFADGLAVRVPDRDALAVILAHVERIVAVSEAEMREAVRHYFTDTHNVAEGAGAAPLAALLRERAGSRDRRVGVVLSGGNIDPEPYREALAPRP